MRRFLSEESRKKGKGQKTLEEVLEKAGLTAKWEQRGEAKGHRAIAAGLHGGAA
jgi:hypothetical protein